MLEGSPTMDPEGAERHAHLLRQVRGPLDLLVEVSRCFARGPAELEQAREAALRLLRRELGIERLTIEPVEREELQASTDPKERAALERDAGRVPIVRRGERIGTLAAELQSLDAPVASETLRILALAAALLAQNAGDRAARVEGGPHGEPASAGQGRAALLGRSAAMLAVRRSLDRIAGSDVTVLVEGESGTGKEAVARTIHEQSTRAAGPFVVLSAASSPEWLSRWSRSQMTSGPSDTTLFVDELGELSSAMQAELLALMGYVGRDGVGDGRRSLRVIAATRMDLAEAVTAGRFRKDLYYRLREFPIALPPLRERRTDLEQLAAHFVLKHAALHRKSIARISDPALELMTAHHWPGNVRELENCISRAVLLAHYGVIRQHHLPPALQPRSLPGNAARDLRARIEQYEREVIAQSLERAGGNRAAAAKLLAVTPRVLAQRIQRLGL